MHRHSTVRLSQSPAPEMIHSIQQALTLSVPLTLTSHSQAQLFYQQQADLRKAKQVYLNTLAVDAVRTYLSWLGIDGDLQASDSWDPVIQTLSDVADLVLPGQGKLECRPVLPESATCYIPPETRGDRIGYLPVLLDKGLKTATLLGFIPSENIGPKTEEIGLETSIGQLQPLMSLLSLLKPTDSTVAEPVHLGEWLQGAVANGWEAVETLLEPQPKFSFRSSELANFLAATDAVARVKVLELGLSALGERSKLRSNSKPFGSSTPADTYTCLPARLSSCRVALAVEIVQSDALQSDIWVKLCPADGDRYLPEAMDIRIIDAQNMVVMEAQSRQTDILQLNFRGMLNEQFTVEVALNDVSLIERFII